MSSGNISEFKNLKQIKSKIDHENLKSDYFMANIFGIMKQNKSLEIVRYNKKLQKRLKISINDYKEYSLLTPIVIELRVSYNKLYNKFINISDEDRKYYHIYIGNSKEEIKRNYINQNESNKKITIKVDYQVKSFKNLFFNHKMIKSINFKKFNRNNITDMSGMFFGCSFLKELNLSNFNTNNVTNMSHMFNSCYSLNQINLSKFITNNVTNMENMFFDCSSLKELNLSNFNTNKVKNMSYMFSGCSSLKELNIYNFNIDNATTWCWIDGIPNGVKKKIQSRNPKLFNDIHSLEKLLKKKY